MLRWEDVGRFDAISFVVLVLGFCGKKNTNVTTVGIYKNKSMTKPFFSK